MGRPAVAADRAVPALILKIGQYPVHSGGVGAIRTLGRLGIPVYPVTEDALTPAALSRYAAGRFVWPTTGTEDPADLAAGLRDIGRRLGRRSVLVPADDESAVLVAEHADELAEHFLFPRVAPELPRRLASKSGLFALCQRHGVPAPASVTPATDAELRAYAAEAAYPVVVKNAEPWLRRRAPAVPGTTVIGTAPELLALARPDGGPPGIIVQEYIPPQHAQDWIVHLYSDADAQCLVLFTGVKVRSWPPHAGVTACAYAAANPALAQLAERFCKETGFCGIADLDWRLDRRDGQYKLVDFNPRMGNQFRLFENEAGIDVVRALHLDLTGRPVPPGHQVSGRRIVVEHADLPARLAYRRQRAAAEPGPARSAGTEFAWLAADDPLPFLMMWFRLAKPALAALARIRGEHRPGGKQSRPLPRWAGWLLSRTSRRS